MPPQIPRFSDDRSTPQSPRLHQPFLKTANNTLNQILLEDAGLHFPQELSLLTSCTKQNHTTAICKLQLERRILHKQLSDLRFPNQRSFRDCILQNCCRIRCNCSELLMMIKFCITFYTGICTILPEFPHFWYMTSIEGFAGFPPSTVCLLQFCSSTNPRRALTSPHACKVSQANDSARPAKNHEPARIH